VRTIISIISNFLYYHSGGSRHPVKNSYWMPPYQVRSRLIKSGMTIEGARIYG